VRELKKLAEIAALLSAGPEVDLAHLPAASHAAPRPPPAASPTVPPPAPPRDAGAELRPMREALRETEREIILGALERTQGNQSQAAKLLGMSRHAFLRRLDEYGVVRPRKR
jgi:DNA-binding NtrC family response regulator